MKLNVLPSEDIRISFVFFLEHCLNCYTHSHLFLNLISLHFTIPFFTFEIFSMLPQFTIDPQFAENPKVLDY